MATQGSSQNSRSVRDMLEGSVSQEQSLDREKQLEQRERELAERERRLAEHEQRQNTEIAPERTEIVSKESLQTMVQDKTREREVVKELEQAPQAEKRSEDLQARKQSSAAKQQKAQVKAQVADDVAIVMNLDRPKQVKKLVYLALRNGVRHAYRVARGMNDPYLIDEFHDALVDQMHGELQKRKKI